MSPMMGMNRYFGGVPHMQPPMPMQEMPKEEVKGEVQKEEVKEPLEDN